MYVKGSHSFHSPFKGGERACVIALASSGDDDQTHTLTLKVYDPQDNEVGTDRGERTAVIWYPPRDADYRVEIRTTASDIGRCYVAVK